jgi:hypothetical protein
MRRGKLAFRAIPEQSCAMTKHEFKKLFLANVRKAITGAQKRLDLSLSEEFDIELHGGGFGGKIVPLDRVIDILWISEDQFNPFIDIAVIAVIGGRAKVFVRPSGYQATEFDQTFNTPKGNGPFKIMEAMNIAIEN